ncbi:tRNA (adenosine(37)-N6)-threonylcarbamoyltransferase complex dimerization subunit type 1 TsaB [Aliihoeflea sp. 40Bstr573]|uniref:tRNA (adenosine(37)-N6)-threonylcarbamoyltransferase complex dimerization subunit type 1 TsaB n=1 Tax=Aliihoeflea sp. 40Bstr573 TaxID=2696467 RepID=UPI002095B736|nr:tRNA (adenosine(37)-N6)-threonylcarbamoyltransferase complex dimerization subunit type 1 TsaB [Aliihoeflea sp. 40Bstr573]MCO6389138.1 tRNA (adenosine(37)-N6)-threonylcarbamoyltransferase complex dimerization subunit type 1 TsaB [Aliihoeflea sp. 40Bstr573]
MIILAIDTSANLCAASVHDAAAGELGRCVRDLGKGHAEHLMAVIAETLAGAGLTYADLDRLGVSVGPGSFTGIRVGVSAARGLALALNIPAVGVTTLEALALEARRVSAGRCVLVALDGGRGEIHTALYGPGGDERAPPAAIDLKTAAEIAKRENAVLVGTAADKVNEAAGGSLDVAGRQATADIAAYASLGLASADSGTRPTPLYLRSADAKVNEGFAVARKAVS